MSEPKTTDLRVESPMPGMIGHFGLLLPTDLSPESFAAVREQIEFRRRCMNQGFDNLLELLSMHQRYMLEVQKRIVSSAEDKPHA